MTQYDTSDDRRDPRILVFDIETTPDKSWTFGPKFRASVPGYIEPSFMLCYAYHWFDLGAARTGGNQPEIQVVGQPHFERSYKRNRRDDRQLVESLWALFDEADIVVAHYGRKFDVPKANARFMAHGLPKPSPFYVVDTKAVVGAEALWPSNSLNDLGQFLELGEKLPHSGFDMWTGCMEGDESSWNLMMDYNVQDVKLLSDLYRFLLFGGWIKYHPPINSITGEQHCCPTCGGTDRQKRGTKVTGAYRYQQYKCTTCNSYYRLFSSIEGTRTTYRASRS